MKESKWTIPESARDWECDWEGSELFHLRYFKALSLSEKMRAVESMEEIANLLSRKAEERRTLPPHPSLSPRGGKRKRSSSPLEGKD